MLKLRLKTCLTRELFVDPRQTYVETFHSGARIVAFANNMNLLKSPAGQKFSGSLLNTVPAFQRHSLGRHPIDTHHGSVQAMSSQTGDLTGILCYSNTGRVTQLSSSVELSTMTDPKVEVKINSHLSKITIMVNIIIMI